MNVKLWIVRGLTLVTLALAVIANVAIAEVTGSEPFLYVWWMIIPIGGVAVAAVAVCGFLGGCRLLQVGPTQPDLPFLMAICLALPLCILALEYVLPIHHGHALREVMSFGQFAASSVTDVRMEVRSAQFGNSGLQPLGEFGWFVLVPRLAALLAVAKIVHTSCGGGRQKYATFGAPIR